MLVLGIDFMPSRFLADFFELDNLKYMITRQKYGNKSNPMMDSLSNRLSNKSNRNI
jgi:hypothetical protein